MASRVLGIKKTQDPAFCSQDDSCTYLGYWCFSAQRTEEMTTLNEAKPMWILAGVSYKMELKECQA